MTKFSWEQYLELSKFIKEQNYFQDQKPELTEAFNRTIISRSYYAIFNLSVAFAERISKFLPEKDKFYYDDDSVHGKIRKFYEDMAFKVKSDHQEKRIFKKVAMNLDDLRKKRNICDYQDEVKENLLEMSSFTLKIALETIQKIESLHIWLDKNIQNE